MGEVRLAQLAKELGTTKKDLMEKLPEVGIHIKKSTVDIDDKLAAQIREKLGAPASKGSGGAQPAEARTAKKKSGPSAVPPSRSPAPAHPVAAKPAATEPPKPVKPAE